MGKSYILKDFIERHSKEEDINVIYVYKEKKAFGNLFQSGKHNCILVDEVQQIEKFEESICNWHTEDNTDVIITGSNSKMLSGDLSTLLAGRYVEIRVHPLTYPEFLEFHGIQDSDEHVWAYLSSVFNTIMLKDIIERHDIRNVPFLNNLIAFFGAFLVQLFGHRKSLQD